MFAVNKQMNVHMTNIAHGNIDDYYMHWSTLSSVLLHFGYYLPRIHICSHFPAEFLKDDGDMFIFFIIAWVLLHKFVWILNVSCSGRILSS